MYYIIWLLYELTVYIHCRHEVDTYHEGHYGNKSIAISFDQQKRRYSLEPSVDCDLNIDYWFKMSNDEIDIANNLSPGSYKEGLTEDCDINELEWCSDEEEMLQIHPKMVAVATETTSVPVVTVDNWEHHQDDDVYHPANDTCCSHRLLTTDDVVLSFGYTTDQQVYILRSQQSICRYTFGR